MHEGVPENRHKVVVIDEGFLDRFYQPVSLIRFGACLMLTPQILDGRFTDKGRWAAADGVDADVGLGAPRPRIDVLHDGPIAGKSLSALTNLSSEGGTFQRLEFAADPDRAKVGEDALAHIEVGYKGHEPIELQAVGVAGLRQHLFRLLDVELRHRQILSITLQGVAILWADPVSPNLADALGFLSHQELPVDGQTHRLTHTLVMKRTLGFVVAGKHEPPGPGKIGDPAQVFIRHHLRKYFSRHSEGKVQLAGLHGGETRRIIPDTLDDDGLGGRRAAPVLLPGLEIHLNPCLLADELVRPSTDRPRLESIPADLLVVMFGNDPTDAADPAVVKLDELQEGFLKMKDDGAVVDDLDLLKLITESLGMRPLIILIGPLDVNRRERLAVVELKPWA